MHGWRIGLLTLALAGCQAQSSSTRNGNLANADTHPRLYLSDAVLTRLRARAAAGDAAWMALRDRCDQLAGGHFNPPSGNAYPNFPDVGQGYQGDGYLPEIENLGLCYRVVRGVDGAREASFGAAGARLLDAMATPAASGGQPPDTDSGYGMRNYGVGLAIGFDWLYPALSTASKGGAVTTLNAWVDWYDANGFIHNDPIGNYFAGYLLAKGAAALATDGDNANAAAYFSDVQARMWTQLVKPAYGKSLAGGGWPEGWEYGPRSVREIAEWLWIVKTAKNLDWAHELGQTRDQARYQRYFAWPSLAHMDDLGTIHSGSPPRPSLAQASALGALLEFEGDAGEAALARAFAADLAGAGDDDRDAWMKLLYQDDSLPTAAYTSQPLSYFAAGPNHVAMRSSWDKQAVWAALEAGTYINASDSGEQAFNEGSLVVVRGDQPLVLNATGWLPQTAGAAGENYVYDDSWTSKTRRLYNAFFVDDAANPFNPGQRGAGPDEASTHIERYDEQALYTRARAAQLEQQYGGGVVSQWTRDLVYLRPGLFVVLDRTTVAKGSADQWLSWHLPAAPTPVAAADPTQRRVDINLVGGVAASVRALWPAGVVGVVAPLPGGTVWRQESHAATPAAATDWLSAITVGAAVPELVRLSNADGNVTSGSARGLLALGARNQVVLFPGDHAGTATLSALAYVVAQSADADHVLVDVAPAAGGYAVSAALGSHGLTVTVAPGGPFHPTAAGTMAFSVGRDGHVGPPSQSPPPGGGGGSGGGGSGGGGAGGDDGGSRGGGDGGASPPAKSGGCSVITAGATASAPLASVLVVAAAFLMLLARRARGR